MIVLHFFINTAKSNQHKHSQIYIATYTGKIKNMLELQRVILIIRVEKKKCDQLSASDLPKQYFFSSFSQLTKTHRRSDITFSNSITSTFAHSLASCLHLILTTLITYFVFIGLHIACMSNHEEPHHKGVIHFAVISP